jgi:hypothetical protein
MKAIADSECFMAQRPLSSPAELRPENLQTSDCDNSSPGNSFQMNDAIS